MHVALTLLYPQNLGRVMSKNLLMRCGLCASTILIAFGYAASAAIADDDFAMAIAKSKPIVDARYRYEFVDQDGIGEDANAHTLRARLGIETGTYRGFRALAEAEILTKLGRRRFNDTVNGVAGFPVVADPNNVEANRYWISNSSIQDTTIKVGRQRILLDNVRYVGNVGWRQNEQTFDAIRIDNTSLSNLQVTYGYLWLINRIFGDDSRVGDFESNSHIVNAAYTGLPFGKLVGYGYVLDFDEAPALSSKTFGGRFTGKQMISDSLGVLYTGDVAWQSDHADNPNSDSFLYFLVEGGASFHTASARVGFERLGGDGNTAFQTPLATLHAHQGWADKFLTTPANGIDDLYVRADYAIPGSNLWSGTKFTAVYHDFSAEETSAHYGTELNLQVSKKFLDHFTIGIKYAHFNADDILTDTDKFWVWLSAKY